MNLLYSSAEATISGANKSMCIVAETLRREGNNVYVLLPEKGPIEEELKDRGIQYFIIKSHSWIEADKKNTMLKNLKMIIKKYANLFAIKKIKMILQKYKIDIVHNNSSSSYVAVKAAQMLNIKTVWHFREFLEEDHGIRISRFFNSKNIIENCSAGIAISKSIYDKFSKIYKNLYIKLIYNGIKVDDFYNEKKILQNGTVTISIIGRVSAGKGQKELIDAIKIIRDEGISNILINIVGDDTYKYAEDLKEYVKENKLDKMVEFIKPTKDIQKIYKNTDILVVASRNEAFGRVAVEGMLSSCLVIGANTAGTKEIVKDMETGILYNQGDDKDLANKLKLAIDNNEKMNEIIIKARDYAKKKFDSEQNARNIANLYYELLKK